MSKEAVLNIDQTNVESHFQEELCFWDNNEYDIKRAGRNNIPDGKISGYALRPETLRVYKYLQTSCRDNKSK